MRPYRILTLLALGALAGASGPGSTAPARAQSARLVRVTLEFQQQREGARQGVQGQGGVIIEQRSGSSRARGRGGLAVEETTTRVTRSSGLFTLVQDGGVGSITVAQEVPTAQLAYFHDYATGKGYVVRGVVWQRVGTALTVRPRILGGDRIRVTLTPVISYVTPEGGGTIEVVEAATDLVVSNGGRLQIGGSTGSLHAVTRQVLGYRSEHASEETALTLTATIQ